VQKYIKNILQLLSLLLLLSIASFAVHQSRPITNLFKTCGDQNHTQPTHTVTSNSSLVYLGASYKTIHNLHILSLLFVAKTIYKNNSPTQTLSLILSTLTSMSCLHILSLLHLSLVHRRFCITHIAQPYTYCHGIHGNLH